MERKKKICKGKGQAIDYGCGKNTFLYGHGLCQWCYRKFKMATVSNTKPKYKPTGEKALFDEIWVSSTKVSWLTGKSLDEFESSPFYVNMFAHVLNKKDYPALRLNPDNIILLSPYEHFLLDQGNEGLRKKYKLEVEDCGGQCDWTRIEKLKEELKIKYIT